MYIALSPTSLMAAQKKDIGNTYKTLKAYRKQTGAALFRCGLLGNFFKQKMGDIK